ncbi:hypothetical protein EYY95_20900 [Hafnia alvei]|uniref:hypothetical protein n=1 Tax=Hafnia alvei TaxID=569 RepID=UPI001033796D|nr:hypothetical protein [Hafnia alvei]TBL82678.1 hypothetical protein EYY95_20900 [Hafnia alvei]
MNHNYLINTFIIFSLFYGSVTIAKLPFKITGIYSSLSFNTESGDVVGEEIMVVFSNKGYIATYQSSDGEPTIPVVTKVNIVNDTITFTLPPPFDIQGEFIGVISKNTLTGKFKKSNQVLILERKNSYWQ